MSKVQEQMDELVQSVISLNKEYNTDLIDDSDSENDEGTTEWEKNQNKLTNDEKKQILRDLVEYAQSENFKEVKKYCSEKVDKTRELIRKEAYNREKCESTKSILDEFVKIVKVTQDIADHVTNNTFKSFLVDHRNVAYDSAIVNKKGTAFRHGANIPFDAPMYTELDLLKEQNAVYSSVGRLLVFCMEVFDVDGILKNKEPEKPTFQPYE